MKWPSWTSFVLGLWLIVSPFALASGRGTATYEEVVLGIVIAALGLWRVQGADTPSMAGAGWLLGVAGAWVLVAPFVLGYGATGAVYNDVIVGALVLLLGLWQALTSGDGEMPHTVAHH